MFLRWVPGNASALLNLNKQSKTLYENNSPVILILTFKFIVGSINVKLLLNMAPFFQNKSHFIVAVLCLLGIWSASFIRYCRAIKPSQWRYKMSSSACLSHRLEAEQSNDSYHYLPSTFACQPSNYFL